MPETFAQLVAPAASSIDADPTGVALAAYYKARKAGLYASLNSIGVTGTASWLTGSVPSSMMEMFSRALADYDIDQAFLAQGSTNPTATGPALDNLTFNTYGQLRAAATFTVAQLLLTDTAGAGPFTFDPTSKSFSVGPGGPRFDGYDLLGTGLQVTLPKNGTVYVYVQSSAAGSAYGALSTGTVTYFARGAMPGVSVTNDGTWLTFTTTNGKTGVAGADAQTDAALQAQNSAQWGTLGTGSPESAYRNWALLAAPNIVTRVAVLTNLDILDPGRVDVIVAGSGGAVASGIVLAVQNYIAPLQVGGSRIPETARCVVTSAANHTITVSATVFIAGAYNTAAFQAQVSADYAAFAGDFVIGGAPLGIVSSERLQEVLSYRAGLSAGIIYDVQNFLPAADIPLLYYEVPDIALSLTWVST